jgi:Ca2+/H+ antiporter, TMEM165/GDT1 family
VDLAAFAGAFGIIFLVELPDKTVFATIVMSARGRPVLVLMGASVALTIQMAIAAVAGGLLAKLPSTPKDVVISLVFLAGAAYLLFVSETKEQDRGESRASRPIPATPWREALTAFTVVFIAEFGDLSQIQAANLVARTHRAVLVFFAATLAVIAAAAIAAYAGQWLVKRVPLEKIRILAGLIFAGLGIYQLVSVAT